MRSFVCRYSRPLVTPGSPQGTNLQHFSRNNDSSDGDEGVSNGSALNLEKKEADGSDPAPRSPRSPHMPTVAEEPSSDGIAGLLCDIRS